MRNTTPYGGTAASAFDSSVARAKCSSFHAFMNTFTAWGSSNWITELAIFVGSQPNRDWALCVFCFTFVPLVAIMTVTLMLNAAITMRNLVICVAFDLPRRGSAYEAFLLLRVLEPLLATTTALLGYALCFAWTPVNSSICYTIWFACIGLNGVQQLVEYMRRAFALYLDHQHPLALRHGACLAAS